MLRLLLIISFAALARFADAAVLREATGLIQIRAEGEDRWRPAGRLPRTMSGGDALRTGFSARAVIALDGGAALELSGNTQISLEAGARGGAVVNLLFGSARISARALGGKSLEVRTPTGTARARSEAVAWRTAVGGGGSAVFEIESGLVAVEDARGASLRLRDGERVESDLAGLHEPEAVPAPARARRDDFAGRMRRELALEQEADAPQRLVAGEIRRAEFELGRALTDASGLRVRAEEFVVRTGPSSFAFVALNARRGGGLTFYSWSGAFDRPLPTDLSGVFAVLPGSAGAPAPWTLTSYVATRSNGADSLVERGVGGHQVDLNGNLDPTDDVAVLFNPTTDAFVNVAGRPVFKVLFDGYGVYSNGVLKSGLTGSNLQSPNDALPAVANDPITGAALGASLPVFTSNTTFPDAGSARQVVYQSYADGTFVSSDNRSVAPGGGAASSSELGGAASGPAFVTGMLKSAFEQTTTASEFGRSVDVMVSPRILAETGGLK
ncbi:MAG: FecR domain-containing protein [Elusimicrobiota bacterium]